MHLNSRISELVRAYRETEAEDRRGPRFTEVALAMEQEMRTPGVSDAVLLECFGPPDLWHEGGFVYFFDHEVPGRNRDEWFFHLAHGKLTASGYNRRGINNNLATWRELKGTQFFYWDSLKRIASPLIPLRHRRYASRGYI